MASDDSSHPSTQTTVSGLKLFMSFLRLGLVSFGGPAMVAYIGDLAVKRKNWISEDTFKDGVGLCQSLPGATAMQTAAYVGLRAGGRVGSLASFAGFGLPAFVLMIVFSVLYQQARHVPTAISAFNGLNVIVVALVANATVGFGKSSLKTWRDVLLAIGTGALIVFAVSPVRVIVCAALAGIVLYRNDLRIDRRRSADKDMRLWRSVRFAIVSIGAVTGGLVFCVLVRRDLFELARLMIKVDLFAFGGGFVSVPLMFNEVVHVRHWMDTQTFMDGIALGQITPGPIVITATFVGYQVAGLPGAIAATIGIFSPSFIMVNLAVPYFDRLQRSAVFKRALRGVLACFVGLLLAVTIRMGLAVSWSFLSFAIAAAAFAALRFGIDILWVALAGVVVSCLLL